MSRKEKIKKDGEMSFLEHLEELRWHIVRSVLAVMLVAIVAFIFNEIVFDTVILAPKNPDFWTNRMFCNFAEKIGVPALCINSSPFQIINIQMAGQFMTHILVSIIVGLILAFPYIFWEFWMFFKPALYSSEKKHTSGAVFFSSLLFIIGILFGYFLIVPLSVHFLGSYNVSEEVSNQISLRSYISTVSSITLAAGLIFQLPILAFFLTKVGLIDPPFMKKYRRHSVVVILALSAIITPPDIFSQVMVCFPLIFLYEIGIMISRGVIRREEKRFKEDDWTGSDKDKKEEKE